MVPNIVPTKIKLLTVFAPTVADADALAEAAFLEWSKDHPGVGICQIDRACQVVVTDPENPAAGETADTAYHVTITVMYDLVQQADAVNTLMRDVDVAMQAWSGWLSSSKEAARKLTLVDMQIHMAQPLAKLLASYRQFRDW